MSQRTGVLAALLVLLAGAAAAQPAETPAEPVATLFRAGLPERPLGAWSDFTPGQRVAYGFQYPYERLTTSYLFLSGAAYPYAEAAGGMLSDARVTTESATLRVDELLRLRGMRLSEGGRTAVLGYGSNGAPTALVRKYVTNAFDAAAVLPVTWVGLGGFDVVWSPHLVGNGNMPATIAPSPGTEVTVFLNWLTDDQLVRMHHTEGLCVDPPMYVYGYLEDAKLVSLDGRDLPDRVYVYVDCYGSLSIEKKIRAVAAIEAKGRRFEAHDAHGAVAALLAALGDDATPAAFLLRMVEDEAARKETTRRIAEAYAEPFPPDTGFRPLTSCEKPSPDYCAR